jgi:hypothetical protein
MPTDSADQAQGLVERLESCTLRVGPSRWPFADAHAA